jgi:hypothetical protein
MHRIKQKLQLANYAADMQHWESGLGLRAGRITLTRFFASLAGGFRRGEISLQDFSEHVLVLIVQLKYGSV